MSSKSFWTSGMIARNDVLRTYILTLNLLLLQTTQAREKSRRAEVHSQVRHKSEFQSVSGPGPYRVWGVAGSQSGSLSHSF
jgi:hypothetical protein